MARYLGCYAPSTPRAFAEWCGISNEDARRSLQEARSTEVTREQYVRTDDLELLSSPPQPEGVRLLPPRDPYLLGRDRASLVPDREVQRRIWRATPTDGVVLVAGAPIATWRTRKTRDRIRVNVEAFEPLPPRAASELEDEAAALATLRGCTTAEVAVTGP